MLAACSQQPGKSQLMQIQIDTLQKKLDNSYKPGLGEFMMAIQLHHAKLWYAGINENWKLANFELQEIQETLEDVRKYNADRPEVKMAGMIDPPLDSLDAAIRQKDEKLFERDFVVLTATCNNCHKATEHEFNVITIPASLPVSNQNFRPAS